MEPQADLVARAHAIATENPDFAGLPEEVQNSIRSALSTIISKGHGDIAHLRFAATITKVVSSTLATMIAVGTES